jgi:hypothetical protein
MLQVHNLSDWKAQHAKARSTPARLRDHDENCIRGDAHPKPVGNHTARTVSLTASA